MNAEVRGHALVVDFGSIYRCLSSAVLGGGLTRARSWFNLQVSPDYSRTDPERHLTEEAEGLIAPVIGMLTAARVADFQASAFGDARCWATVGARHAIAAAATRPRPAPRIGTINMLVIADAPLTDAALVGAVQTAVEAKAQALADAGVRALNARAFATGTATDSLCVVCPPGSRVAFAGPATRIGGDIARAVHRAVFSGASAERDMRRRESL